MRKNAGRGGKNHADTDEKKDRVCVCVRIARDCRNLHAVYLRSGWILHPLPMILYGGLGLTLVASVVGAIILAVDGVRLLLRRPVGRWYKIVLDFVPLLLWLIFWML